MTKKYRVTLTDEERKSLRGIINTGKHSAQKRKRAQALLLTDEGMIDNKIAERVGMHRRGVEEVLVCSPKPDGYDHWNFRLNREPRRGLIPNMCGTEPANCLCLPHPWKAGSVWK